MQNFSIFRMFNLVFCMNLLDPWKFTFSLFSDQNVFLLGSRQFWDWFVYHSQIVRVELQGAAAFLYSRLVPLVLLLVEGNWRFWNIIVCFTWEFYLLISLHSRFHAYRYWRTWMGNASGSKEDNTRGHFEIWTARFCSCP